MFTSESPVKQNVTKENTDWAVYTTVVVTVEMMLHVTKQLVYVTMDVRWDIQGCYVKQV